MSLFRWSAKKLFKTGEPTVFASRCVRTQSPLASCSLCRDVCPQKGIAITTDGPLITDCSGCGLCVRTCPQNAFEMDLEKIFKRISEYNHVIIGCKNDPNSDEADIRIGCLQQLRPEDALVLADAVDELILFADATTCKNCVNDFFPEGIVLPLEQYGLPCADRITVLRSKDQLLQRNDTQQMDRRRFLRHSASEMFHAGQEATGSELIEWLQQRGMYDDQPPLAARSCLVPLFKKYGTAVPRNNQLSYPMLHARKCVYCGACAMMCPQDAILLTEEEGRCVLKFAPTLCSKCDLCLDVCRINGLYWDGEMTTDDFLFPTWPALHTAKRTVCSVCGMPCCSNDQDEAMCSVCSAEKGRNGE